MSSAIRIALALAAGIALGVLAARWLYTPPTGDTAALRTAIRAEQARGDSLSRHAARVEESAAAVQEQADRVRESRDRARDRADRATAGLDALSERAAAETARADRSLAALSAQIAAAQTADSSPSAPTRPPAETAVRIGSAAEAYPDTASAISTSSTLVDACTRALSDCTAARRALALYADSLHAALDARAVHALHADTGWRLAEARADTLRAALDWQRRATGAQAEAAAAAERHAREEGARARALRWQRDLALGGAVVTFILSLVAR